MIVELTREQRDMLLGLINSELTDIGPEIRHTTEREYRDDLRQRRLQLGNLRDLLSDVPEPLPSEMGR